MRSGPRPRSPRQAQSISGAHRTECQAGSPGPGFSLTPLLAICPLSLAPNGGSTSITHSDPWSRDGMGWGGDQPPSWSLGMGQLLLSPSDPSGPMSPSHSHQGRASACALQRRWQDTGP